MTHVQGSWAFPIRELSYRSSATYIVYIRMRTNPHTVIGADRQNVSDGKGLSFMKDRRVSLNQSNGEKLLVSPKSTKIRSAAYRRLSRTTRLSTRVCSPSVLLQDATGDD